MGWRERLREGRWQCSIEGRSRGNGTARKKRKEGQLRGKDERGEWIREGWGGREAEARKEREVSDRGRRTGIFSLSLPLWLSSLHQSPSPSSMALIRHTAALLPPSSLDLIFL